MLYLSITIIVLLLIDLNNFWKTKNDIKKTKEDLAKLNFGQIYQLHECINENDPIIRIPDNADYYVTENLNLLEARSYITTVGTNLYKIPDNTFELLKNVDFEEFGIKKEAPEELGY